MTKHSAPPRKTGMREAPRRDTHHNLYALLDQPQHIKAERRVLGEILSDNVEIFRRLRLGGINSYVFSEKLGRSVLLGLRELRSRGSRIHHKELLLLLREQGEISDRSSFRKFGLYLHDIYAVVIIEGPMLRVGLDAGTPWPERGSR